MNFTLRYAKLLLATLLLMPLVTAAQVQSYATIGQIFRLTPQLDRLIPPDAKIELIAAGFGHLEGPAWVSDSNYLLVNDTQAQITYKWSPSAGQR